MVGKVLPCLTSMLYHDRRLTRTHQHAAAAVAHTHTHTHTHTMCLSVCLSVSLPCVNVAVKSLLAGADPGIKQRGAGWRARERQPIAGVWGQSPQRGPGAEPLVRGSGGQSPLKLKKTSNFFTPKENQHLATFQGFLGNFLSDPVEVTDPFSPSYTPDIEASGATIHHQNG